MFKKFALSFAILSLTCVPVLSNEILESVISVDASINREVAPDTAKIRFYVENSGTNLADLKQKNDKTVTDAMNSIKTKLAENESIKTIAFSVRNIYSYKDKIRIFQKYEVQNGFEVKLKDLDKISEIINLAMEHGVKNISGVNFTVENSQDICNQMISQAVNLAQNRAKYVANASGVSLSKVKSINPYCSLSAGNYEVARKVYSSNIAMDSASSGAVSSETIEPGTINARASVNMSYYLK